MGLGRKLQDIFDRYVAYVIKKGKDFDFYKAATALNKGLAKDGLDIKAETFFAKVFEELENPRSNWKIKYEDLKTFFSVIPDKWKKRRITPEILVKWVPRDDWDLYGGRPSTASLKKLAKANYIKKQFSKDAIADPCLTLIDKIDGGYNVKAYLGDITKIINARSLDHYDYAYDAIEEEIGKDTIEKALEKVFANNTFKVKAWPNLASITDASYEIDIKTDKPSWLIHQRVSKAIREILET